jgi:hypothetical protein
MSMPIYRFLKNFRESQLLQYTYLQQRHEMVQQQSTKKKTHTTEFYCVNTSSQEKHTTFMHCISSFMYLRMILSITLNSQIRLNRIYDLKLKGVKLTLCSL